MQLFYSFTPKDVKIKDVPDSHFAAARCEGKTIEWDAHLVVAWGGSRKLGGGSSKLMGGKPHLNT